VNIYLIAILVKKWRFSCTLKFPICSFYSSFCLLKSNHYPDFYNNCKQRTSLFVFVAVLAPLNSILLGLFFVWFYLEFLFVCFCSCFETGSHYVAWNSWSCCFSFSNAGITTWANMSGSILSVFKVYRNGIRCMILLYLTYFVQLLFCFLQYWRLNSGPSPWATPPVLFLW
jgi:hypothetical protein